MALLLIRIKSRLNKIVREIIAKTYFLNTLFSSSKLLEILFALCKSPRIAFFLMAFGDC